MKMNLIAKTLLCIVFCFFQLVQSSATVYKGDLGSNVKWEVNTSTGVLTISGTGAATWYSDLNTRPYYSYESYIKSIQVKSGITELGSNLFSSLMEVTSVSLPTTLEKIGKFAFYHCRSLKSITIPSSVTFIDAAACFAQCGNLTSIVVDKNNTTYDSRNNCNAIIETTTNKLLVGCPTTKIPSGIEIIGACAFFDYYNAPTEYSIVIPEGVTTIEYDAFNYNRKLKSITLPSTLKTIGHRAFYNAGFESIVIPKNVEHIGENALGSPKEVTLLNPTPPTLTSYPFSTSYLETIFIPYNSSEEYNKYWENYKKYFVELPYYDFESNGMYYKVISEEELTCEVSPIELNSYNEGPYNGNVVIPSIVANNGKTYQVVRIGDSAFEDCYNLESISIPNSIESIGTYAFASCQRLKNVDIPNSVKEFGYGVFFDCYSLTSATLPEDIEVIGSQMFEWCENLASIVIPKNVTEINRYAFTMCKKLSSITSLNLTPPTIYQETFWDNNYQVDCYDATLYVPYGAKSAYKSASYWKKFKKIVEINNYDTLNIVDGENYDQARDIRIGTFTYTRTLPNLYWNALYVPFELPYDVIADGYDVAYINDVNGYDTDDNGTIDDLAMEIIKIKGGTLKANYPYLIKAKTEADRAMSITVEDAVLYAAAENSINCSSVFQDYAVTGIYTKKTAEELEGKLAISTSGAWQPLAAGTALNPFRLYLSIENREGSPVKVETTAMSRMRIVERGETTDIETIAPVQQHENVIFDLSGRRVKSPGKGGVYIINGKKRIF